MLIKWCDLSIIMGDFNQIAKVINNYEKVAKKYLSTGTLKTCARDYFFKAGLCFLANEDKTGARRALETYGLEDPAFDNSR